MFFKRYHIVKIIHINHKNIYKIFQIYDTKILISFLKECYNLVNFKVELILDTRKINISEIVEINNLNPNIEKVKLSDLTITSSKKFIEKYKINDYKKEHYIYKDTAEESDAYKIYMPNKENDFDLYLFPDFNTFYDNLKKIKKSNIAHQYLVEPSIISVENYLKILNLYGNFENRNFNNSFEINQYINDMRQLSSIAVPSPIKLEIT